MPRLLQEESDFLYEFSDGELIQILYFTNLQLQYFISERSRLKKEKANLTVDPIKLHEFIQREAELGGMINIYDHLINSHKETITALSEQKAANATAAAK